MYDPAVKDEPVVVIGASTAGLFAAYLLARGGVPVRVFDAARELGPPARTLIVTSQINAVLGFVPSEAIVNRTPRVELFSSAGSANVVLREPDLIVERETLVRLLAEKARRAGAEIRTDYRFLHLEPRGDGLLLSLRNARHDRVEHLRTRYLIGADGVFSQVARAAGQDSHSAVPILQALVALPEKARPDTTQVWFDPQSTPYFYWLIPESQDRAAVGLIAEACTEPSRSNGREARESLDGFLAAHGLEPLDYQAAQVSLYAPRPRPWCRMDGAQVFLVGDAAGHVKVTTVGGVVTGLRGARAAARAILRGSDFGGELRGLRWELDLHLLVRRVLSRFTAADYDALLDLLNHQTTSLLSLRTRDELSRMFLRLILAQPRLLDLTAKAVLRALLRR
ncbi:MAG: FAD-dependent monooxygenase [Anaerolineae bacterium]